MGAPETLEETTPTTSEIGEFSSNFRDATAFQFFDFNLLTKKKNLHVIKQED